MVGVSDEPGEGFFNWARELGVLKEGQNEEIFWRKECEKVYEAWKIPCRKEKTKLANQVRSSPYEQVKNTLI